jgi:hypothetical protein
LLPFKEKDYLLDYLGIFFPAYGTNAGSKTMSDVILKAGSAVGTIDSFGTGAKGEDSLYYLQGLVQ